MSRLYFFLLLLAAAPLTASARGVTPYLPLNLAPAIERDIERVLVLADKAILTRPIPAATVYDALPSACAKDRRTCERVRRYLERYMRSFGVTELGAELDATDGNPVVIPNAHGRTGESHWQANIAAYFQLGDYILINGGGLAYDHSVQGGSEFVPVGSFLSLGVEYAQLDVGYRDRWYSPLTDSSMLISTQAPTMPSVGLSNYKPISALGISYDIFAAEMSESQQILYQGNRVSGKPRLSGIHVAMEPVSGWSLGANRLLQYGGGPRPSSYRDLLNAFSSPSHYENGNPGSESEDFGNQVASFTSRFIFPGAHPFSVYFEYAGEDTSRGKNYRLGNSALSAGIYIPNVANLFDLTYEVSEWQNLWYVNSLYGDGLTNKGLILGHWGAERRLFGEGVGAQSHMLRIGGFESLGGIWDLRFRSLKNQDYGYSGYVRSGEATLQYVTATRFGDITGEGTVGRDSFGDKYWSIGIAVRYGDDPYNDFARQGDDSMNPRPDGAELFVDTGVNVSRIQVDLGVPNYPLQKIGPMTGVHLGLGARRAVAAHHDLGVRIEGDGVDGNLLLGVRALDYRYRAGAHLAFTGFLGAARLDLATPAYGYYGGVGAQWREIFKNWDCNLDLRYYDSVARDKLYPNEQGPGLPDRFYDISSISFGASYKF